MILHQCVVPFLLVLLFDVEADPVFSTSQLGIPEHEAESLGTFSVFASKYGKKYASMDEYKRRFLIFKSNQEEINRLNKEHKGSATFGVNKFADLTDEEFRQRYTPRRITPEEMKQHEEAIVAETEGEIVFVDDFSALDGLIGATDTFHGGDLEEDIRKFNGKVYLPKRIDYRKKKLITPVKSQGTCGSCWAFSTISNIEGIYAKATKKVINLSEQELLDCDKVNEGCKGGLMELAIMELIRLGGVANSTAYPYTGRPEKCLFTEAMTEVKVSGNKALPFDENEMAKQLVKTGPISVGLHASSGFKFYESGVYDPSQNQCDKTGKLADHAVSIVGYGVWKKQPFWIVRNSWGGHWGEKGYIRLARGKNACGINRYASTAVL